MYKSDLNWEKMVVKWRSVSFGDNSKGREKRVCPGGVI